MPAAKQRSRSPLIACAVIATGPRLLAAIETSISSCDARSVQHAAHTLKGMAGNFADNAAFETAGRLEEMARRGTLRNAAGVLRQLQDEIATLRSVLSELCTGAVR